LEQFFLDKKEDQAQVEQFIGQAVLANAGFVCFWA